MSPPENAWTAAPDTLALAGDEVQVWRIALDQPDEARESFRRLLNESERARADRFRFAEHRARFTVGRGWLRTILGRYLNVQPGDVVFRFGPNGKPSLDPGANPRAIQFNLSHSRDRALLAVTVGREVGIDIEAVRAMKDVGQIVGRFFSPREVAVFNRISDDEKTEAFFRGWTRKEAYMKATGKGFAMPLEKFDVTMAPGEPARLLAVVGQPEEVRRWSFHDLDPGLGFAAALAVEGGGCHIRCYELSA